MGWINIDSKHIFSGNFLHHHTVVSIKARVDYINLFLAYASDLFFCQLCANSYYDYPSIHLMCVLAYKKQ